VAKYDYDITIIGAGPGGYVAAIKAAKEGKKPASLNAKASVACALTKAAFPRKRSLKPPTCCMKFKNPTASP
jgi:dihydrolipoamide dehydrogenase